MREDYYKLILRYSLSDTLSLIEELSFSKKYELIKDLLKVFPPDVINRSLYIYHEQYIKINRINLKYLKNLLKNLCMSIILDIKGEKNNAART